MADFSNLYCQRNARYKGSPLGKGVGGSDIYFFGCYFVSLCRKLGVDPIAFNKVLLSFGLWDDNNYIVVNQLAAKMPDIFASFIQRDSFTMDEWAKWCADDNVIIVAKVDARGIGGSGTHFVSEESRDAGNAIVFDPWFGDIIKVATRYGNYGNILSLRIFTLNPNWKTNIKKYQPTTGGQNMSAALYTYLGVTNDTEAIAKIKEHLGEANGKCNWGAEGDQGGWLGYERKNATVSKQKIADLDTQLTAAKAELEKSRGETVAANEAVAQKDVELGAVRQQLADAQTDLKTTIDKLVACENKPQNPFDVSLEGWTENGLTVESTKVVDGVTITETRNYKKTT